MKSTRKNELAGKATIPVPYKKPVQDVSVKDVVNRPWLMYKQPE